MVELDVLMSKIGYIEKNLAHLESLRAIPEKDLLESPFLTGAAKHYLQTCIETKGVPAMGKVIGNIMVQKRGVVSLGLLKEHMPLNDGDIFQVQVESDKVILIPMKLIPADQAWYWTKEWQEGEKEAEADISAGRVKSFDNMEDLLEDLDK